MPPNSAEAVVDQPRAVVGQLESEDQPRGSELESEGLWSTVSPSYRLVYCSTVTPMGEDPITCPHGWSLYLMNDEEII